MMDEEKTTEIIPVSMGFSNVYLIKKESRVILVDTGSRGTLARLEKGMVAHKISFKEILLVIVTHAHYDHTGCLNEIKQRSGAQVLVHKDDAANIAAGNSPLPAGTGFFARIIIGIGNMLPRSVTRFEPVEPDILIDDSYDLSNYIPGVVVMHTPGHTNGSISVIVDNTDCIVGDTLFNIVPFSVYPPFADSIDNLATSMKKLIDTGCRRFFPGHGRPFSIKRIQKTLARKR